MKVYICPMCLNTVIPCSGNKTGKGRCTDCRYDYRLSDCGIADRKITGPYIEVRA